MRILCKDGCGDLTVVKATYVSVSEDPFYALFGEESKFREDLCPGLYVELSSHDEDGTEDCIYIFCEDKKQAESYVMDLYREGMVNVVGCITIFNPNVFDVQDAIERVHRMPRLTGF